MLSEDKKTYILSILNTQALRGNYWHNMADVARLCDMTPTTAKRYVFEMVTEGLLSARDGDTDTEIILVSVPKGLRTRGMSYR